MGAAGIHQGCGERQGQVFPDGHHRAISEKWAAQPKVRVTKIYKYNHRNLCRVLKH